MDQTGQAEMPGGQSPADRLTSLLGARLWPELRSGRCRPRGDGAPSDPGWKEEGKDLWAGTAEVRAPAPSATGSRSVIVSPAARLLLTGKLCSRLRVVRPEGPRPALHGFPSASGSCTETPAPRVPAAWGLPLCSGCFCPGLRGAEPSHDDREAEVQRNAPTSSPSPRPGRPQVHTRDARPVRHGSEGWDRW